jgi:hypothetical protein
LRATAAWFVHLKRRRRALRVTAGDVQQEAKQLAAARDIAGAQRMYVRMRQIAQQLDRSDLELAAVSDLAGV